MEPSVDDWSRRAALRPAEAVAPGAAKLIRQHRPRASVVPRSRVGADRGRWSLGRSRALCRSSGGRDGCASRRHRSKGPRALDSTAPARSLGAHRRFEQLGGHDIDIDADNLADLARESRKCDETNVTFQIDEQVEVLCSVPSSRSTLPIRTLLAPRRAAVSITARRRRRRR
jgi:hypothetical protein